MDSGPKADDYRKMDCGQQNDMSLYLYCLREPSRCGRDKAGTAPENCFALSGIKSQGVNGKEGVIIRAFDGIEAVVSDVNTDDFGEMQKKAQEDIHWIREKALAHEMVVEEAMGKNLMDMNSNVVAGVGDPGPAGAEAASAGRPLEQRDEASDGADAKPAPVA